MLHARILAVFLISILSAGIAGANTGNVVRILPGCIVEFEGAWRTRIAGISIPGPEDPFGRRAFDLTRDSIEGRSVKLFTWTVDDTAAGIVHGDDGLPYATILFGEHLKTDIAAVLLEKGYALVDNKHLPEGCEHYSQIEAEARSQRVGIWSRALEENVTR